VNRVEVTSPPIITIASGRSSSPPWPRKSTSGSKPNIAHAAVINFGRTRLTLARRSASIASRAFALATTPGRSWVARALSSPGYSVQIIGKSRMAFSLRRYDAQIVFLPLERGQRLRAHVADREHVRFRENFFTVTSLPISFFPWDE
jgi:hypothetical protein